MCVIINIEDGNFPKLETLKSAEKLNSHGGSIAFLIKGKLCYQKNISAKKINKIINNRLIPNGVKTAIIHFRIASVGNVNARLCHPFPISKEVKTDLKVEDSKFDLLFHNGTVSNWEKMLIKSIQDNYGKIPKGELSDSRIIAFLLNRHGHGIIKDSTMNKFSILTKNGIVKYGSWVKVDKNDCSNDYFVKKTTSFNTNFEDAWYGGGYYNNANYGTWINGKKQDSKNDDKLKSIQQETKKQKKSLGLKGGQEEIDVYLKTKEDLEYYNKAVKDYKVTDDEILDHLCDGFSMHDTYCLFEDIYGDKNRYLSDEYTPLWECEQRDY